MGQEWLDIGISREVRESIPFLVMLDLGVYLLQCNATPAISSQNSPLIVIIHICLVNVMYIKHRQMFFIYVNYLKSVPWRHFSDNFLSFFSQFFLQFHFKLTPAQMQQQAAQRLQQQQQQEHKHKRPGRLPAPPMIPPPPGVTQGGPGGIGQGFQGQPQEDMFGGPIPPRDSGNFGRHPPPMGSNRELNQGPPPHGGPPMPDGHQIAPPPQGSAIGSEPSFGAPPMLPPPVPPPSLIPPPPGQSHMPESLNPDADE